MLRLTQYTLENEKKRQEVEGTGGEILSLGRYNFKEQTVGGGGNGEEPWGRLGTAVLRYFISSACQRSGMKLEKVTQLYTAVGGESSWSQDIS